MKLYYRSIHQYDSQSCLSTSLPCFINIFSLWFWIVFDVGGIVKRHNKLFTVFLFNLTKHKIKMFICVFLKIYRINKYCISCIYIDFRFVNTYLNNMVMWYNILRFRQETVLADNIMSSYIIGKYYFLL